MEASLPLLVVGDKGGISGKSDKSSECRNSREIVRVPACSSFIKYRWSGCYGKSVNLICHFNQSIPGFCSLEMHVYGV